MKLDRFLAQRAQDWSELDALVRRAGGRGERLDPAEIRRLGLLYRAASADLALARREFPDAAGTFRLHGLVASAHALVYGKAGRTRTVRQYFATDLWRQVRSAGGCLWLSVGILVGATGLGVLWALLQPAAAAGFLPAGFHASVHPGQGGVVGVSIAARAGLATQIFTNNITVSFQAVAGGFTLGLLTVYALAYNGAMLGILGALEWRVGGFSAFIRLIVPHGILEMSMISLSGAAGLLIARAIVDPGHESRADALAGVGVRAAEIVLASASFLVLAGLTEGFVTPSNQPLGLALGVGLLWAVPFWVLVLVRGRPAREETGGGPGPEPAPLVRAGPGPST